jgi:hypothetical protein
MVISLVKCNGLGGQPAQQCKRKYYSDSHGPGNTPHINILTPLAGEAQPDACRPPCCGRISSTAQQQSLEQPKTRFCLLVLLHSFSFLLCYCCSPSNSIWTQHSTACDRPFKYSERTYSSDMQNSDNTAPLPTFFSRLVALLRRKGNAPKTAPEPTAKVSESRRDPGRFGSAANREWTPRPATLVRNRAPKAV